VQRVSGSPQSEFCKSHQFFFQGGLPIIDMPVAWFVARFSYQRGRAHARLLGYDTGDQQLVLHAGLSQTRLSPLIPKIILISTPA